MFRQMKEGGGKNCDTNLRISVYLTFREPSERYFVSVNSGDWRDWRWRDALEMLILSADDRAPPDLYRIIL